MIHYSINWIKGDSKISFFFVKGMCATQKERKQMIKELKELLRSQ